MVYQAARSTSRYLEKQLLYIVALPIIGGFGFGYWQPGTAYQLQDWLPYTLFLMLYPVMLRIQIDELLRSLKDWNLIIWALFLGLAASPFLAWVLASMFLGGIPALAAALILLGATPCAVMIAAWTSLSRGNTPLAVVIVALSLFLSVLTLPLTSVVLIGRLLPVDPWFIFLTTLQVILLPLMAGELTRRIVGYFFGPSGIQAIIPFLSPLAVIGLLATVFICVAAGAEGVTSQWQLILIALPALCFFYIGQIAMALLVARRLRLPLADYIAFIYSALGKNTGLAMGLAAQFMPPLAISLLALNAIIQTPVLALFQSWFLARGSNFKAEAPTLENKSQAQHRHQT